MLNKRYTIKKVNPNFSMFPEMVVGASFEVTEFKQFWDVGGDGGATEITMDSGTVYNIKSDPEHWCFYTPNTVSEYLIADKPRNKLMRWEKREKQLIAELEFHRKNKPV